jgi:type VI secretion system protein ImpA
MSEAQTVIDIDALVAALPEAGSPCGPDLEYDPDFISLFLAATRKPERQSGESVVPAEEPDWADVRQRSEAILARSKDIRVAVLLTRALTRTENLDGLWAGLQLTCRLLSRFWDEVNPRLDPTEDLDPTMRLNALASYADSDALLGDLRSALLVPAGKQRRISVRDILGVTGKLPLPEGAPTQVEMETILADAASRNEISVAAINGALTTAGEIRSFLMEKVGGDRATDLSPLIDALKSVVQVVNKVSGVETSGDASVGDINQTSSQRPLVGGGEIRSREDAVLILERVCAFIERNEPANPAPLFIRRARQLLTKSFIEIIQDLAPDSLGQIQKMVGLDHEP